MKNVRAFGLLLEIDPGKLDMFENSPTDTLTQIVQEWFDKFPMEDADRWEKLGRVLLEPAVREVTLASGILRRGSSADSAISDVFSERSGSISSPTFVTGKYDIYTPLVPGPV